MNEQQPSYLTQQEIVGFENYLSDKARELYNSRQALTIVNDEKGRPIFATTLSAIIVNPASPVPPGHPGHAPEWAVKRMANIISDLVDKGVLVCGVLAPAIELPLVALPGMVRRIALILYVYPSPDLLGTAATDKERIRRLNDFTGEHCFTEEGELGEVWIQEIP